MKHVVIFLTLSLFALRINAQIKITVDTAKIGNASGAGNVILFGKVSLKQVASGSYTDKLLVLDGTGQIKSTTRGDLVSGDRKTFSSELTANPFSAAYNTLYNKTINFRVGYDALGQTQVRVYFGGGASNDGGLQSINYKDFYFAWNGSSLVINTSDPIVSKSVGTNYIANNLSFGTPTIASNVISIPVTILSTYNIGAGATINYRIHLEASGMNCVLTEISFL